MTETVLRLNDGQVLGVEVVRSDDARIQQFEAGAPHHQRWCLGAGSGDPAACAHCKMIWLPGPGRIVTAGPGNVVAASRIGVCQNGDLHGHLTLTLAGPFEDTNLGALLLKKIREDAKAAGFERLYACFLYRHHDVIRDCQDAGFHIESVLSGGSVSEVVLRVDADEAPVRGETR